MSTASDAGTLGQHGVSPPIAWTTPGLARACARRLVGEHERSRTEIVRNPHLATRWAHAAVRSPGLLSAVQAVIGPAVAVENTFLLVKWPGRAFDVPWHQDGVDEFLELDPARSVTAWLALSDVTEANGCLHVAVGSQSLGYLPTAREPEHGHARGRSDQAVGFSPATTVPVPLSAGSAVLMDSRLLHRSGSNTQGAPRVGLNVRYAAPGAVLRRAPASPSLDRLSGEGW